MVHRRGGGYQQVLSREEEQAQLPATGTHQSAPKSFRIADYKLDDTDADLQPHRIPYGSVALAVFLMLFGMVSFVLAWLHYTQQILGKEAAEIGFTVLGLVTFVPGFYHTRIAYYAWKGYKGFSWDDIPAYD